MHMKKRKQILYFSAAILAGSLLGGSIATGYFIIYKNAKNTGTSSFIMSGSNESYKTNLTLQGRVPTNSTLYDLVVMGQPVCEMPNERINLDNSTELTTYQDPDTGLKFEVPYNPQWGAPYFLYKPYDEKSDHNSRIITFGKPLIDTCNEFSTREYRLEFAPAKTKENTIANLKETYGNWDQLNIDTLSIDDKTIIHVIAYSGHSDYTAAIVIGKKYNYILTGRHLYESPLTGVPLEIIKSMKLY